MKEELNLIEDIWSEDSVKQEILNQVQSIAKLLIDKNKKYGNSALLPKRIFSHADPLEQINVRIDDKLSRIANQQANDDEDAEFDLIGYLILKRVLQSLRAKSDMQKTEPKEKTVING